MGTSTFRVITKSSSTRDPVTGRVSVKHSTEEIPMARYGTEKRNRGWDHELYFGTVTRSMLSIFEIITRSNGWSDDLVRHILQSGQMSEGWIIFPLFMIFTTHGLLFLVVGILVDAVLAFEKCNVEKEAQQKVKTRKANLRYLQQVFASLDEDNSGQVSFTELLAGLENPECAAKLARLNFPVDDPGHLFSMLIVNSDADGGELVGDVGRQGSKNPTIQAAFNVGNVGGAAAHHAASKEGKKKHPKDMTETELMICKSG